MARNSGEEERQSGDEGKVEEWEEGLLGGDRHGGIEGVESGEFNGVGCTNGGKGWMGVVADDAETASKGVGGVGFEEWFWCWVMGGEGEGGEVTRDNGLGSVGVGGIGCHGEREVVWVRVGGALMWKGCVGVGTMADWVAVG